MISILKKRIKIVLGVLVLFSYMVSTSFIAIRSQSIFVFGVFLNLSIIGLTINQLKRPREWYVYSALAVLALALLFFPREFNATFSLAYLALFLGFVVSLEYLGPRFVEGKVIDLGKNYALIKINGDFLVGIHKGIYASRKKKGIRIGDSVLLEVRRKWGEREGLKILKRLS